MYVLPEGKVAYFDVDDTLVKWYETNNDGTIDRVAIHIGNFISYKEPIKEHIDELILQAKSGTRIVVWSASGVKWAEAVVKALKLEEYVDAVLAKPDRYYDDKDVNEWIPKRRYYKKSEEK